MWGLYTFETLLYFVLFKLDSLKFLSFVSSINLGIKVLSWRVSKMENIMDVVILHLRMVGRGVIGIFMMNFITTSHSWKGWANFYLERRR